MGFLPTQGVKVDNITLEIASDGTLRVKDLGIITSKIANNSITYDKIANQTDYPKSNYTTGTSYVWHSNDTSASTNSLSPILLKEILLPSNLPSNTTLTISFALGTSAGSAVYAQIYRNGTAVGTQRSTTSSSSSPQTFTEDISNWNPNDKLQLYAWSSGTSINAVVSNFRILTNTSLISTNATNLTISYFTNPIDNKIYSYRKLSSGETVDLRAWIPTNTK
jgi:hypothetical protein